MLPFTLAVSGAEWFGDGVWADHTPVTTQKSQVSGPAPPCVGAATTQASRGGALYS